MNDTFTEGAMYYYPGGLNCSWLIKPTVAVGYISIKFDYYSISYGDYVTIYNGSTTASPIFANYSSSGPYNAITIFNKEVLVSINFRKLHKIPLSKKII